MTMLEAPLVRKSSQPGLSLLAQQAVVAGYVTSRDEGSCEIDHSLQASIADSLGLQVNVGDLVAILETQYGCFIVSILKAAHTDKAELKFPFAQTTCVSATELKLVGVQGLEVLSPSDVSIRSGKALRLSCRELYQSVVGAFISKVASWTQRCDYGELHAQEVLRTQSKNQLIGASKDIHIDAQRINMG